MKVLELHNMVIGYGEVPIVRGLDMEVASREVVALLGANGVGKTTTLRGISGMADILGGEGTVLGSAVDGKRRPDALARAGLVHVPENRGLFPSMTVGENLEVTVGGRRTRSERLEKALAIFPQLRPLMRRRAALLSGGEQQMLAIARAVMLQPKLLMIDEMSLGLAPLMVDYLLATVREIAAETGCAVLLVEQHIELALQNADRAYVLSHGEVAVSGSVADLLEQTAALQAKYFGQVPPPGEDDSVTMTSSRQSESRSGGEDVL